MSEQKPREWWINFAYVVPDVTDEHPHKSQFARRNFDNSKVVHVIEKSAYDSLKAENEQLKELVCEVNWQNPSFDDSRIGWIEIQLDRDWIERAKKAVK